MSQENVEVVRHFDALLEGRDIMPEIRTLVERLGPAPTLDAVLTAWAEHPVWKHLHPDIEWDAPIPGLAPARGAQEVVRWWGDWVEAWQSYVPSTSEYHDLGEWV